MNAEQFYEHFKEALAFLGVAWGDMEQVTITIEGEKFVMSVAGKSCSLRALKEDERG